MHFRMSFARYVCLAAFMAGMTWAQNGGLQINVADPNGLRLNAGGELRSAEGTTRFAYQTGPNGFYTFENVPAGAYVLSVASAGFEAAQENVRIEVGTTAERNITLQLERVNSSVVVRVLAGSLDGAPGSTAEITRADLDIARPFSIKEGLRRITGVHIVDEDAFGLNLNIGIRGLDPRRTQRTLLLEDGAPVHLAPYSDPSAHYHTPPELIETIEMIKGSGQIMYGPQTVGGMLNFVTQPPPDRTRGELGFTGGTRDLRGAQAKIGTGGSRGGILGNFLYREGAGTRINHSHRVLNGGVNGLVRFRSNQSLQLKSGYYTEDSAFTEGGMSQAQFDRNPLSNPFSNDRFNLDRFTGQALHRIEFNDQAKMSTNFYYQDIDRVSYRQADFAGDEMTANAATGCTGAARTNYDAFANLCGNKMRPRSYRFFGIEPRADFNGRFLGMRHETSAGIRYHREDTTRRRFNGLTPDARENSAGVLFRDWNTIRTNAFASYVQTRLYAGNWTITPGVRLEHVDNRNLVLRRGNVEQNTSLQATQTMLLPGIGVTYRGLARSTIFGGIHRGFAPPRPDDNFDPLDPAVRPVSAERSTNYELGIRTNPGAGLQLEATLFRIDFSNQIVAGETVGLPQITWVNAGKTLNSGVEFGARYDMKQFLPSGHNVFVTAAYTRLFTASFNSALITDGVNVFGNRLPYAPGNTFTPTVTYLHRTGVSLNFSVEHISRQFADSLNLTTPSADGQNGVVPSYTVLNSALNIPLRERGPVFFISGTNLADRRFITSRVDGIQVGRPRQVFGGIRWAF